MNIYNKQEIFIILNSSLLIIITFIGTLSIIFSNLRRRNRYNKLSRYQLNVINGDLKHEFGIINRQEWDGVLKIIDLILKYSKNIILVKYNFLMTQ